MLDRERTRTERFLDSPENLSVFRSMLSSPTLPGNPDDVYFSAPGGTSESGQVVSRAVINKVSTYLGLLREHGVPVSHGVLYGSYARGEATPDSNIDLLVVSSLFDQDPRARVGELWRLAGEVDVHIEPVPVGKKRFAEDHVSPLLEIARREGLVVFGRSGRGDQPRRKADAFLLGDRNLEKLEQYFAARPNVLMAFAFGSAAMGRSGVESDVDLAVYFRDTPSEEAGGRLSTEILAMWSDLEGIVGRDVDLVVLNLAPPGITWAALRGKPLLIRDRRFHLEYLLRVSAEAEDFQEFVLDLWRLRRAVRRTRSA